MAGALGIAGLGRRARHDVATALTFVMMLGVGALFVSWSTEYAQEAYSLLFGEVFGVSQAEVLPIVVLGAVSIAAIIVMFRPLMLSSAMPEVAEARGVSSRRMELAFLLVMALATSMTVPVVGALLMFSLMIGPAAAARSLTARPVLAMALSVAIALVTVWVGIAVSYQSNWPLGFFVGIIGAVFFLFGQAYAAARRRLPARGYGEPRVLRGRDRAVREGPSGPSGRVILRRAPQRGAKRTGGFRGVVPPGQHSSVSVVNRLKDSTSPYLLQHADNPVDWWPWCDEAFAEAARRDVPVMLSVGYAACHWCHVMAHESFEDPATAAVLNEHVVAVKVDREERPDVDAVYMTATQAMTGQGGWPMTVFMTPEAEPFFCGTYYPPGLLPAAGAEHLAGLAQPAGDVTDRAKQVATALAENASATGRALREAGQAVPAADAGFRQAADAAVLALDRDYDTGRGGFGGAPKFPPSMVLEFLLRYHQRTGSAAALRMAEGSCEAMARGGMYDQLGGGFARYSVDAGWVVPHFEKMLYDNALLARVYANLWRRTGSALARRVAEETCDWMLRELRTGEGGLAASLDADSEGEEGKFYVWRPAELHAVLGPEDGAFAAQVFGVTEAGTFEHGASVLQRRAEPARRRTPGPGPGRAAGRPRPPGPPGPRRQGGRRVERAGHLRAGRMRAAVRAAGLHRGRARRRRPAGRRAPGRRTGSSAPRGTGPPGAPRGRSRTTPASPRGSSRCPG